MLRKSYLGFWIWMMVYIGVSIGIVFLPIENAEIIARIGFNLTNLAIVILTLIIYLSEKVYWYTGITYEQAVESGSERRKSYALKHVKVFGIAALIYLIVSVIITIFNISFVTDTIIFTVIILIAAIYTMKFKL